MIADLVEVRQAVGILAESLVLATQSVPGRNATKLLQINHVQSAADNNTQQTLKKVREMSLKHLKNVSETQQTSV